MNLFCSKTRRSIAALFDATRILRLFFLLLLTIPIFAGEGTDNSSATLQKKMQEYERIMQRYFRVDPAKLAQVFNARAQLYDKRADTLQKAFNAERARLDLQERLLKELETQIAALDAKLQNYKLGNNPQAVAAYNHTVKSRNDLVARYNPQREALNNAIKKYNTQVQQSKQQLESEHKTLSGQHQKLEGLADDYVDWFNSRKDEAFWLDLNRTLARLLQTGKNGSGLSVNSTAVAQMIQKIRSYRRELGEFARTQARSQKLGEIIVKGRVADQEDCYLLLDTGAAMVTLTPEFIQAISLNDQVGGEIQLRLAGGLEMKGQRILIPKITILGREEQDVEGAIIPHPAIGVDGLLGRSFLHRFTVTLDGTKDPKLIPRSSKP